MQTAYQVLSDPQERAWYDSHEAAILRGDSDPTGGDDSEDTAKYERNIGVTSGDDITRLLRRFNANVEFTDAPSGFFGFLRDTFETLAREEEVAAVREALNDAPEYPSFGHKDDEYDDVVKSFYAVWNGFATRKTFAWRDRYRTSDAEDRRTRRLMEKENKRFRDEGIREFNDAVRLLVAFVRKRDPRFTPNTQTEAERQDALRKAAAQQAATARAANAKMMADVKVAEWTKTREPEELVEEEEEESEEEHFECVACRKTFKSENQWEAHERSKKHLKAVQALRKKLQREGQVLDLDDEGGTGVATPMSEEEPVDEGLVGDVKHDDQDIAEVYEDMQAQEHLGKAFDGLSVERSVEEVETVPEPVKHEQDLNSPNSDSDSDSSSARPDDLAKSTNSNYKPPASNPEDDVEGLTEDIPKLGKAAQKRARKAAAAAPTQGDQTHRCATCNAAFPSKTRLFQHIKDHGHAAPVPSANTKGGKGKKGKR